MKYLPNILLIIAAGSSFAVGAESKTKREASTIVLDETGVKNLRIETVEVEEADFEETVFSLGRVESIPSKVASISSRIPGRIVELKASLGDMVKLGDEIVKVESRQPGDPPPVIPLKAPIAGLLTEVNSQLGDPVEPDKAILEISDLSEVYAIARVPEHNAGRMKPGTVAHIKVVALPNEKFDGELLRFGTSADKQSGTIDAVFRLKNPGGLLRENMRAEFSIVLSKRSGVLSVPRSALQGEASTRFVYVKDFDLKNAFVKTPVQVGEMNDRYVEILGGILAADEVVTQGAYSLSFAGATGVSLKEALDAAHGHEHAEDGSEMTPEKRAEAEAKKRGVPLPGAGAPPVSDPTWMYVSGVLLILLVVSLFSRKKGSSEGHADAKREVSTKEGA